MNVNEDNTLSLVEMQKQSELKVVPVCKIPKKVHYAVEIHNETELEIVLANKMTKSGIFQ